MQPAHQLARSCANNALKNSNQKLLSSFALEEEYTKYMQVKTAFPFDIDDMNVYSYVL